MSPWKLQGFVVCAERTARAVKEGVLHIRDVLYYMAALVADAIVSRTRTADGQTSSAAFLFRNVGPARLSAKCILFPLSLCSLRPSVPASLPPSILVSAAQGQSVQNICTPRQAAGGWKGRGQRGSSLPRKVTQMRATVSRASWMPHSWFVFTFTSETTCSI